MSKVFHKTLSAMLILAMLSVMPVPAASADTAAVKKPIDGIENILPNGGVEVLSTDGKSPDGWGSSTGWGTEKACASIDTKNPFSGGACLKIATEENNNPFAVYTATNIVGGAEYQLSFYVLNEAKTGFPTIKMECYSNTDVAGASCQSESYVSVKDSGKTWTQIVHSFKVGMNVSSIKLLPRLLGTGTVYFDNISLCLTGGPPEIKLDTDWIFYYPDIKEGTAVVTLQAKYYPDLIKGSVSFALKDKTNILKEEKNVPFTDGQAEFGYELSLLTKKKKEYTIEATLYDASGKAIRTNTQQIYKYDRPTYLRADGVYEKNGKVINPVITYHPDPKTYYQVCGEAGINVAQSWWNSNDLSKETNVLSNLDYAEEHGMMLLLVLYNGKKSAGEPTQLAETIKTVNMVKDHPALFAYALMDEPFLAADNPLPGLQAAYKAIRDIDPHHPTYICEALSPFYRDAAKVCDILAIDPYGSNGTQTTCVTKGTTKAIEAVDGQRPVYSILQAFKNGMYFPTVDDERNMIYQAFFAGAKGIGFYRIIDMYKSELWPAMVDFNKKEMGIAFDHFTLGKYQSFNDLREGDVWYHSFVKDNDVYVVALNQSPSLEKTLDIPLISYDGRVTIKSFNASVYAGAEESSFKSEEGVLSVTLKSAAAVVYKVTPINTTDFSGLTTEGFNEAFKKGEASGVIADSFNDLDGYDWAREQIEALYKMNIVNAVAENTYSPEKNITRADFAMFLVRTLGLTSGSTENFDDVDQNSYYAKELAIGKALGILNGVGDGKFNPETEISRQDMMTICARGMRFASKLGEDGNAGDVAAFSDASLIADYALTSITAMVREGIVKGNADGTVNPLGNTTRAEAAVVMYRILTKQ